ncbi:MAG: phosphoenolpyruvate carboxykinase [Acidobacteriota bacterium]
MRNTGLFTSRFGIDNQGFETTGTVYWNQSEAQLYEHAIKRGEATIAAGGPLVTRTGEHTGRAANDKFVVREPSSQNDIWWGKVNKPIEQRQFDGLLGRIREHWQASDLFVFDGYAGADPSYRINVRVINENAWQNLFARNMFVRETEGQKLVDHVPDFTVINAPSFRADPAIDGTYSGTFILLDIGQRMALIGGTQYAGEIKKSIFTVMNYMLPKRNVMAMHCSANYGKDRDDVALFFGLSGTGKTTLSADQSRTLIGDDEHGWSDNGVFNMEGGCYAKVIRLDPEGEPAIFATTQRFGTILENVICNPDTRCADLDDASLTENTRASYPLEHLSNVDLGGTAGHPKNVIFLTCDAFGVLPPISRLTEAQAMYHFLSGYTAKVAGTEKGVTEPSATFSTCFGAPFMPLHPGVYGKLLGEKLSRHRAKVWLINTGWTGGPHGIGSRMRLSHTRRMVTAALSGELDQVATRTDPIFGLAIPERIEGVPQDILTPRKTWADPAAYDTQVNRLADMFIENFKQFEDGVDERVKAAAPAAEVVAQV